MYIEVITPDRMVYAGEVSSATFPGSDGSFQVLNNHAPLVSALAKGHMSLVPEKGAEEHMEVEGGVVEVLNNKIIVLAEKVVK